MTKKNLRQEEAQAAEGWVTVLAAAELAKVGDSTIYRWLDAGALEERRIGGRRYVSRASVEREAGKATAPAVEGESS